VTIDEQSNRPVRQLDEEATVNSARANARRAALSLSFSIIKLLWCFTPFDSPDGWADHDGSSRFPLDALLLCRAARLATLEDREEYSCTCKIGMKERGHGQQCW
jgi:hypothetical protein